MLGEGSRGQALRPQGSKILQCSLDSVLSSFSRQTPHAKFTFFKFIWLLRVLAAVLEIVIFTAACGIFICGTWELAP